MEIQHLFEADIDPLTDVALRELLSLCFPEPYSSAFKQRRYLRTPPAYCWIIRTPQQQVVAHLAIYKREVQTATASFLAGGVGGVCVHPDFRKNGYVHYMLEAAHTWLEEQGFFFTLLFGQPKYYATSGYFSIENLTMDVQKESQVVREPMKGAMACELNSLPWPKKTVFVPGPKF